MAISRNPLGNFRSPSKIIIAAFLTKLAKHLALLSCLAIVGHTSGQARFEQSAILIVVLCAALLHSLGVALKSRLPNPGPWHRDST